MSQLRLRGLRAGNLKQLDLDLPQGQWTAVHGPSGAGKSALLFRTLEPIARQRFRVLEDPRAVPGVEEDWLPLVADSIDGLQPVVAAAGEIPRGRKKVEVGTALDLWAALGRVFAQHALRRCPSCDTRWRPLDAESLLARVQQSAEGSRVLLFSSAANDSSAELIQAGWTRYRQGDAGLARLEEAPEQLGEGAWLLLDRVKWRTEQSERVLEAAREAMRRRRAILLEIDGATETSAPVDQCPQCGTKLPQRDLLDLAATRDADDYVYADRSWADWCRAPLEDWQELPDALGAVSRRRIQFLARTRMGHLHAMRELGTLSLGEGRRLELVALLAQVRRGQLALFDEPGMGLHGSERRALAGLIRELVAQGNTVLTADPAREFLEAADAWLLLGPGGGPDGGEVVGQGPRANLPSEDELAWNEGELPTGQSPDPDRQLRFRKLRTRFLNIPKLDLPLGRLVAIVGVSGSGKSTLLDEELVPRIREERDFEGKLPVGGVRVLSERALGSSAFSTVATLSGAWTEIRASFAEGEEGRMRGLSASDLVAREGQGACGPCRGHGVDGARLPCSVCGGLGLRDDLLELRLRNRSLRAWLTTPLEALEKRLPRDGRLRTLVGHLIALGLGKRTFGERGRYLSLGERGRIALAKALASARRDRPQLFLLDEPCLGLPFREARKVVLLLHELCRQGHGFWVAEHHEVLVRAADHVIELGPEAGPRGGQLLYAGTAQKLSQQDTPTGRWFASKAESSEVPELQAASSGMHSEALAESFARPGRSRLESDLQRELSTRSPLLADLLSDQALEPETELGEALPPTAWPSEPQDDARLLDVLGLAPSYERVVREQGQASCAKCAGAGPWPDLAAALRDVQQLGLARGELNFTIEPCFPAGSEGAETSFLLAAGFRRIWRDGERQNLRTGDTFQASDALWLDRFDPSEEGRSGRLQDLEHQAGVLGGHRLTAHDPDGEWHFQSGACRDCGVLDAAWVHRLAGQDIQSLCNMSLHDSLAMLQRHAADPSLFERAQDLLRDLPFLRAAGKQRWSSLDPLTARLVRMLGWLLAPLEGVRLLHDQPLAGLPPALARRLAAALSDGNYGCHVWTDAEGHAGAAKAAQEAKASTSVAANWAWQPESFSLGVDVRELAIPPWERASTRLREALGVQEALLDHYLRTEEARVRAWGRREFAGRNPALRCQECAGAGARAVHPELHLSCPSCAGSGWQRETAVLEDRGLRWTDLGRATLSELAKHFQATPAISRALTLACESGLGELLLDQRMHRLPLGLRAWAPILAQCATTAEPSEMSWIAVFSGWNRLEVAAAASTIEVFASRYPVPVWRENHPVFEPSCEP